MRIWTVLTTAATNLQNWPVTVRYVQYIFYQKCLISSVPGSVTLLTGSDHNLSLGLKKDEPGYIYTQLCGDMRFGVARGFSISVKTFFMDAGWGKNDMYLLHILNAPQRGTTYIWFWDSK